MIVNLFTSTSLEETFANVLMHVPKTPSLHSNVVGSMLPYNSPIFILLGFTHTFSTLAFLVLNY
jgi:hypothetical protein